MAGVVGYFLNAYFELVVRTSQLRVEVDPAVDQLVHIQGVAVIYALWHRHLFFLPLLRRYGRRPLAVLLSLHRDAQMAGVAARLRGFALVSGSSTRGGTSAYRQLLQCLRGETSVCITPDGPKGPPGMIKPGIIHLAERAGAFVVPVAFCSSSMVRLKSWDKTIVPLPFGKHLFIIGAPINLATSAALLPKTDALKLALDALTAS